MSMRYFGMRYDAPAYTECPAAPVPIGKSCGYCKDPIAESDSGWLLPFVGKPGDPSELPYHRECFIRTTVGSVAHQQKRCTCFGGIADHDDKGLSRREEAREAVRLFLAPRKSTWE